MADIPKIVENQEIWYRNLYHDSNYIHDYASFRGLDIPQALIKTAENALKNGLTSENIPEYLEGSSEWPVLSDEDKVKILNHFNVQNTEASGESKEPDKYISYPLSENQDICYNESSHEFFTFSPFSKNPRKEAIIRIPIKFNGIVIDDDSNKFINAKINNNSSFYSLEDFKNEVKKYAITGNHLEKVMQFLLAYVNDENNLKNAECVHMDNIYIDNKKIKVANTFGIDKIKTLKIIYKLYKISTVPDNFATNLAYFTASPLSYPIREKGKIFPYLINTGVPGAGKTKIQELFAVKGYKQNIEDAHAAMNDIKTPYTLMKLLNRSILPTPVEEITNEWLQYHSELLKSVADSTHAGSRGYFNKVIHYAAKSQVTFDSNDKISSKIADEDRYIVCNFPKKAREKQNIKEFDSLESELEPGFMFSLFDAVFGDKNLDNVIKEIYAVKDRNGIKKSIIKYVLDKLNSITTEVHFELPDFDSFKTENNMNDWPSDLYSNLEYIIEQINSNEKFGTYNLNKSQISKKDKKIYITRTGFSILKKALDLPFKSIDDFDHNTMSANFTTSITTFRFNDSIHPQHCLLIAPIESNDSPGIRKLKDDIATLEEIKKQMISQKIETESIDKTIIGLNAKIDSIKKSLEAPKANNQEENKTINPSNSDIYSLPDGPVKKSLIEEQELKEFKKDNLVNSQEKKEVQKPREIPKNPMMYYYKIMDHFEAYGASYFDDSDIILDSYRSIYKKNSTNVAYALVKLLIPENLSKQPDNWMRFLSDSQPISQKQFEVLSKGDVQ